MQVGQQLTDPLEFPPIKQLVGQVNQYLRVVRFEVRVQRLVTAVQEIKSGLVPQLIKNAHKALPVGQGLIFVFHGQQQT